jgi:NAD(P)-dependent dehydrogenase (short-subunit alcohol dehydrogenase family)
MPALMGKVVVVIGNGTAEHRSVAVALAESGADIAVAGNTGIAEVLLHSIANEVWALGRRSAVVGSVGADAQSFAEAVGKAIEELGRGDLVVRVEPILSG